MLGDVPDMGASPTWWFSQYQELTAERPEQAQEHPEQCRLPGAVRTEDGHELPLSDCEVGIGPDGPARVPAGQLARFDDHWPKALESRARSKSLSSPTIHCSKVSVGGWMVSETPTTGMFC